MPVGVSGSVMISEHDGVLGIILPGVCYGRSKREVSHPQKQSESESKISSMNIDLFIRTDACHPESLPPEYVGIKR